MANDDGELWIFGYGSLLWRPDFTHAERSPALLTGWSRRFWQGSTDHRGVPGAPGRVVTLVPEPTASCWGMAYRLEPGRGDAVLGELDRREQGGFERHTLPVRLRGRPAPVPALVYVAAPGNRNYLGPAPLGEIAAQVLRSRGPSGANREYVVRLAETLRAWGAEDLHVFALASLVGGAVADSSPARGPSPKGPRGKGFP